MSEPGGMKKNPAGLERFYVLTSGRSGPDSRAAAFDVATLVISQSAPAPGMQYELEAIVRWCRNPLSMAELGSYLGLPFSILAVLVSDLLEMGRVEARHPLSASPGHELPDLALLQEVLSGLQGL